MTLAARLASSAGSALALIGALAAGLILQGIARAEYVLNGSTITGTQRGEGVDGCRIEM